MMAFAPQPEDFFERNRWPRIYRGVSHDCQTKLIGFGAYFQLKICDYLDRCFGETIVSYDGLERNLPTLPAQAAVLRQFGTVDVHAHIPTYFNNACKDLETLGLLAPPAFDRLIGPAEVETILCDWKRAKYGNHVVGDDVLDKRRSLENCGDNALIMRDLLPPAFPLDTFRLELE